MEPHVRNVTRVVSLRVPQSQCEGAKKGGGHPRKKRESRITWAVIFAVIVRARADIN